MLNQLASAVVQTFPMAVGDCIPTNDIFTDALTPVFDLLVGGVGSVLVKFIITGVLLFLLIRALVNIVRSRRANEDISSMAFVAVAFISAILLIVLITTVVNALNGLCATL